jgi:hopanoid-associated phosphorylase
MTKGVVARSSVGSSRVTDRARIGIVTGLPQESALLRRAFGEAAPPIFCSGADPSRVPAGVAGLVADGCDLLVSFGFAGGLDPALVPADVILADRVATLDGRSYGADAAVCVRIGTALDQLQSAWRAGTLAGVDRVLETPADKRIVASKTGAIAADMESHFVAAAGLPFVVLRVIIDPADRAIPPAVTAAVAADGSVRPLRLAAGLLRRPGDLAALAALARDSRRARPALGRAAAALARFAGLV